MATLTIRQLDDDLKQKLRIQAAENGRSMEAEAREILRKGVDLRSAPPEQPLGNAKTGREMWHSIRDSFKEIGYVEPDEIQISPREKGRELPTFE